jgi:hypothetical protein
MPFKLSSTSKQGGRLGSIGQKNVLQVLACVWVCRLLNFAKRWHVACCFTVLFLYRLLTLQPTAPLQQALYLKQQRGRL